MSGLVGENRLSLEYAVVDQSKKRKNVSKPSKNLSTNMELHSVVNKNKVHREKPQTEDSSHQIETKSSHPASTDKGSYMGSVYSVLRKESGTNLSSQRNTFPNSQENILKSVRADRKLTYAITTFIIIVLLNFALVICTSISFSMITMLRSDVDKLASNNSIQIETIKRMVGKFEANLDLVFNATLGISSLTPASSCQAILAVQPSALSGYYWVRSSNGSSVQVYCEMTMKCNGTRGLQRVALINNETRSEVCVGELTTLNNYCISRNMTPGCSHVTFPVHNVSYSHICGLVEGYSNSTPDGFKWVITDGEFYRHENSTINDNYVDGISLTYGQMPNRQHIWTFVMYTSSDCDEGKPDFVSNSSFSCFHKTTPHSSRSSFSMNLFKQLQWTTSEDIEVRLCRDQNRNDEDVAINNAEIYVW